MYDYSVLGPLGQHPDISALGLRLFLLRFRDCFSGYGVKGLRFGVHTKSPAWP